MSIRWPLSGRITSHYGDTKNRARPHTGTDIYGPTGSMIQAGAPGRVAHVGTWAGSPNAGQVVMVDHNVDAGALRLVYCHTSTGFQVSAGAEVNLGTDLAPVGTTGTSQGGHTHIEAFLNGRRVNPEEYMGGTVPAAGGTALITEEEDEMKPSQVHWTRKRDGKTQRALFVPGTAYWLTWQENGAAIANGFARNANTGSSTAITESMANAMERAAAQLLPKGVDLGTVTVEVDSKDLAAAIEVGLADEFAAIPGAVADEQAARLKS